VHVLFSDLERRELNMKEIKLVQFELKESHGCFENFKKCADLCSTKGSGKKAGVNFDAAEIEK
jgi:hypothetical protein